MVKAVVGANWGDEGKGKITDMLAKETDIIVRFQDGANAGHTIVNDYGKFALHTLPSGVFYNHTTSIIGNGVALNIPLLFKEVQEIVSKGVPEPTFVITDIQIPAKDIIGYGENNGFIKFIEMGLIIRAHGEVFNIWISIISTGFSAVNLKISNTSIEYCAIILSACRNTNIRNRVTRRWGYNGT